MIRYLFTTSTSQPTAHLSGRDRRPAAKCDQRSGSRFNPQFNQQGFFSQIDFLHGTGSAAYGASTLEFRRPEQDGSNLSNYRLDRPIMDNSILVQPILEQPIWSQPILGQPILGQQLDRVWRQRSGRYGCTTVPRED